jgi:hypothetical protein
MALRGWLATGWVGENWAALTHAEHFFRELHSRNGLQRGCGFPGLWLRVVETVGGVQGLHRHIGSQEEVDSPVLVLCRHEANNMLSGSRVLEDLKVVQNPTHPLLVIEAAFEGTRDLPGGGDVLRSLDEIVGRA